MRASRASASARTPMSTELSSGITCFEITPGLLNSPEEVDQAVAAVKALAV